MIRKNGSNEHERQRRKQAISAAASRDITIPKPKDLARRRACLADPFEFMRVYFAEIFKQPFTASRRAMVEAIEHAALFGGDYAVADFRGNGKSKLALFTSHSLLVRRKIRLPLLIGKNQAGAENELLNLKREISVPGPFADDFPEIAWPLIRLEGTAGRAYKQTCNGLLTNILWQKDCVLFPTITNDMLGADWPTSEESLACGQGIGTVGIDGRIRGWNRRNIRPDLAVIDDIDDRESARSQIQTDDFIRAIEQDVAGLAESGERCARVLLCTTLNRQCVAYQYTDRKAKPGWRGMRYRALETLPQRQELWDQYIELRCNRDPDKDPDARVAHAFYVARKDEMDAGAVVGNPYAYQTKLAEDGEPLELSALQSCYNKISDTSWDFFAAEYQNDPPAEDQFSKAGISRELVQSRKSGLQRRELPPDSVIVIGVDIGKHYCHWVAGAFRKNGSGAIVDYGVIEVVGTEKTEALPVIERAIIRALTTWKDSLTATPFVDGSGNPVAPSVVLIDSGYSQSAVFEFVRRFGEPFRASHGVGAAFRHGAATPGSRRVGRYWFATPQADRVWLFSLAVDYWKRAVHERFIADPLDENGAPNPGALTIFVPAGSRDHSTFSAHIMAEEWVTSFTPGKGEQSKWIKHSSNNHWLDGCGYMLAAAEMFGYGMFPESRQQKPRVSLRQMQDIARRGA